MNELELKVQKFYDNPDNEKYWFIDKDELLKNCTKKSDIKKIAEKLLDREKKRLLEIFPEETELAPNGIDKLLKTKSGYDAHYKHKKWIFELDYIKKSNGRILKIAETA